MLASDKAKRKGHIIIARGPFLVRFPTRLAAQISTIIIAFNKTHRTP